MKPSIDAATPLMSWSADAAQRILEYVARVSDEDSPDHVAPKERIAVFDNDGTLWCERPNYVQAAFVVDELSARVQQDPSLSDSPVVAALVAGDVDGALRHGGLGALAEVLLETHAHIGAEAFTERARSWLQSAQHPQLGRRYVDLVYQPMLELLDHLRAHQFRTFIVTGGGVEFVRAVSDDLYGIDRDDVIGSAVQLDLARHDGRIELIRQPAIFGSPNEGAPKAINIQMHIGRRPIVAAGNTAGDREMLEYTAGSAHPTLCLAIDHDDAAREFAYEGASVTQPDAESLRDTARMQGWTVVSMRDDWNRVFATSTLL
jgi:phosphoserine phosphatase